LPPDLYILNLQFNAPNSISVGAPLQIHWATGLLTALPRPPTWISGVLLLREVRGGEEAKRGKEGEGTKRGREGKGGRPFLDPLPFPICYATGSGEPFAASGTLGDLAWLEDFLTSK